MFGFRKKVEDWYLLVEDSQEIVLPKKTAIAYSARQEAELDRLQWENYDHVRFNGVVTKDKVPADYIIIDNR